MSPLGVAVGHGVPAVVVQVKQRALGKKQEGIDEHLEVEHAHHVAHEIRVEQEQREGQRAAEKRGDGIRRHADLHELVGHVVVARIAGLHPEPLDDQNEQRHGENEGGEEQVHLRNDPDHRTAADANGRIIAALGSRGRGKISPRHIGIISGRA